VGSIIPFPSAPAAACGESAVRPEPGFRDGVPSRAGHPFRHCLLDRLLCLAFPRRDIWKGDKLYMRRFYLVPPGGARRGLRHSLLVWLLDAWVGARYGVRVRDADQLFLHHILRDDDARALHDHPWRWITVMFAGAYTEILPEGRTRETSAGDVRVNPATHTHRVIVRRPVWTLVAAGLAERAWGFHPVHGWADWRTHLGLPDAPDWPEDRVA
jgi:hypothetical protein